MPLATVSSFAIVALGLAVDPAAASVPQPALQFAYGLATLGVEPLRSASAGESSPPFGKNELDFERWLSEVKFVVPDCDIPPIGVKTTVVGITISVKLVIHGLTCDGLHVGSLRGLDSGTRSDDEVHPVAAAGAGTGLRPRPPPGVWGLVAEAVSLKCVGEVSYSTSFLGLSGRASTIVSASAAKLGARLRFNSSDGAEIRVPDSMSVEQCDSRLGLKLQIDGGSLWTLVATKVPGVVGALEEVLNREADKAVCDDGSRAAARYSNMFLAKAHDVAHAWIQEPVPAEPPMNKSFVQWQQMHAVKWVQQAQAVAERERALDRFVRYLYDDGRVCLVGDGTQARSYRPICLVADSPMCLLGGDGAAECIMQKSLRAHPSTVLRVEARAAEFGMSTPNITLDAKNATMGLRWALGTSVLRLELGLSFEGFAGGAEGKFHEVVEFEAFFDEDLRLDACIFAGLDAVLMARVPEYDLLKATCVAPSFRQMRVVDLVAHLPLKNVALAVVGPHANSSNTSLVPGAVGLAEDLLRSMLDAYGPAVAPMLLGLVRSVVLPKVDSRLQSWVSAASAGQCPEPKGEETEWHTRRPLIDPARSEVYVHVAMALSVAAVTIALLPMAITALSRCRQPLGGETRAPMLLSENASLPAASESRGASHDVDGADVAVAAAVEPASVPSQRMTRMRCLLRGSLMASPAVSWSLALSLPVAVVALGFFCLGSNYMRFAETFITLRSRPPSSQSGTEDLHFEPPVEVYDVMVYSLFYSVKALKDDHLAALAYVVLAFSGILPYLKLCLMLISWMMPAFFLPRCLRGWVLLAMDQFGKYSLVDVFVIQFISASLSATLDIEYLTRNDGNAIVLSALVTMGSPSVLLRTNQGVGFASFVLATVGSLLIGHVNLHCHRKDEGLTEKLPPLVEGEALPRRHAGVEPPVASLRAGALRDLQVATTAASATASENGTVDAVGGDESEEDGALARFHHRRRFRLSFFLVITTTLVIFGCCMTAFTVRLDTPFGTMSESSFTLFGLAARLPSLTEHENSFATRFGQVTYITFAFATILCHLVLLGVFMFAGIADQHLRLAATAARTLFAWSALDVAVGSMMITLLEMETSNFVVLTGSSRVFLGKVLKLPGDYTGNALKVAIRLGPAAYLLTVGAFVHFLVSRPAMSMLDAAATDYEQAQAALHRRHSGLPGAPSLSGAEEVEDGRCRLTAIHARVDGEVSPLTGRRPLPNGVHGVRGILPTPPLTKEAS